jgi:hypothetical protein
MVTAQLEVLVQLLPKGLVLTFRLSLRSFSRGLSLLKLRNPESLGSL